MNTIDRESLVAASFYQNRPGRAVGCMAVFGSITIAKGRITDLPIQYKLLDEIESVPSLMLWIDA